MSKKKTETATKEETKVEVAAETSTAVVAAPSTGGALVTGKPKIGLASLIQNQGAGLENMKAEDMRLPFVNIIQANSPQRKKDKPEFIPGAEEGFMFNTGTKQIYDGSIGLRVLPIHHEKRFIERTPKDPEGKKQQEFVKDHGTSDACVAKLEKIDMWNYRVKDTGNLITPTDYIYFYIINVDGSTDAVAISFKSSLAEQARNILNATRLRSIPTGVGDGKFMPPLYWKTWTIRTAMKSKHNNDWFVYSVVPNEDLVKVENGDIVDNMPKGYSIFESAAQLYEDFFKEGKFSIDHTQDSDGGSAPTGADKAF